MPTLIAPPAAQSPSPLQMRTFSEAEPRQGSVQITTVEPFFTLMGVQVSFVNQTSQGFRQSFNPLVTIQGHSVTVLRQNITNRDSSNSLTAPIGDLTKVSLHLSVNSTTYRATIEGSHIIEQAGRLALSGKPGPYHAMFTLSNSSLETWSFNLTVQPVDPT